MHIDGIEQVQNFYFLIIVIIVCVWEADKTERMGSLKSPYLMRTKEKTENNFCNSFYHPNCWSLSYFSFLDQLQVSMLITTYYNKLYRWGLSNTLMYICFKNNRKGNFLLFIIFWDYNIMTILPPFSSLKTEFLSFLSNHINSFLANSLTLHPLLLVHSLICVFLECTKILNMVYQSLWVYMGICIIESE